MVALYDPMGNYIGEGDDPYAIPPTAPGALNLYKPIAPNATQEPPLVQATPQVPPSTPSPVMDSNAPMGMSFNGRGVLSAPPPVTPGALSSVPAADPGILIPGKASSDGGLFSFMNNPGATDSLVAFGSAMLRAPDFNTGLADAADAVNKVAQQYRPISDVEINNLNQRAMVAAMARRIANPQQAESPPELQKGDIWYSPDGRAYREVFNPAVGSFYQDVQTGEQLKMLPPGSQQRVDSSVGERSAANAKLETEARDSALKAGTDLELYNQLETLVPTSGVGPDVVSRAKRGFVQATGIDLEGVDLSDMQVVNSIVRQIELQQAQTQRGLGQLTEAERAIIRESLATLDTNPQAFRQIISTLRSRAQKAQRLYEEWLSMPPDVKNAQYNGSFENFAYFWRKANSAPSKQTGGDGESPPPQNGERPSLDSIFNP